MKWNHTYLGRYFTGSSRLERSMQQLPLHAGISLAIVIVSRGAGTVGTMLLLVYPSRRLLRPDVVQLGSLGESDSKTYVLG